MLNIERQLTPSWDFVRPSVDLVRKNSESVVFIVLLPALVTSFGTILTLSHHSFGWFIVGAGVVWRIVNVPVSYVLQLDAIKKKRPEVTDCYRRGIPYWPRVILFEIWFTVLMIVGFVCLIVPALIIFRRYFLTPYYIINKNLKIGPAMTRARNETLPVSGYVWGTFGVTIVFTFIAGILGNIAYIGPILTALVSLIYYFGPALRWQEVSRSGGKSKA